MRQYVSILFVAVHAGPPDLLKIDLDGFEPNVLAGASRLLEGRPLVFLEFSVWTLLVQHYDPLVSAEALYRHCDMLMAFAHDKQIAMPRDARCLVHANMMEHGCVTDLLLRPRTLLPDLEAMTRIW